MNYPLSCIYILVFWQVPLLNEHGMVRYGMVWYGMSGSWF